MKVITPISAGSMETIFKSFRELKEKFSDFHSTAVTAFEDELRAQKISISSLAPDGLSFEVTAVGQQFSLRLNMEEDGGGALRGILYCLRFHPVMTNTFTIQDKFTMFRTGSIQAVRNDDPGVKLDPSDSWLIIQHLIHSALRVNSIGDSNPPPSI